MNNKICLSLPISSENVKANIKTVKAALRFKPHYIELRFDFINDLTAINQDLLKPLLALIKSNCSSIFTFRNHNEGGKIKLMEDRRLQILKELISSKPDYLDIEMETSDNILLQIINLAINEEVSIIFSNHDFKKTPPLDEIRNYINLFIDKLKNKFNLDLNFIESSIYKTVFTAEKLIDNLVPLNLCHDLQYKFNIVSFCMGREGLLSRIFCTKFGSFFTYGSLEKETAPGQIKIEKMREIYRIFLDL